MASAAIFHLLDKHVMNTLLLLLPILAAPQVAAVDKSPRIQPPIRPNIIMVLADDFGVDLFNAYDEGNVPPCTPHLDTLAGEGMLFRNAWTNPVCTPTRAAVLTGRYGFRTGMGGVGGGTALPASELIVPEMLLGYESSAVGKWHLGSGGGGGGAGGNMHPNSSGFDYYAGALGGGVGDYYQWQKVTNGQTSTSTTYATTDTADEAIAAMLSMPEPWFLYVSFNAPHSPWHEPPDTLCPNNGLCQMGFCGNLPSNAGNRRLGKAMVEAMDTEFGRVLQTLEQIDPDALVVFMGDNGTPGQLSQAPFESNHAKGTMYEGGVNVPLIIKGTGVAQGECDALVSSVDLFATFADVAGAPDTTEDSISLVPYFSNPHLNLRETVYSEIFSPNGSVLPIADHRRAIRDRRYKLIRENGQPDEFYDLLQDPFETSNLLPNLGQRQQLAFDSFEAQFVAYGVD
ncbi:MAG: arylsulfatase B [Planctomycetota bacterium]|jgi:arylsulfatase B